jgi:hypothetical protein
MLTGQNSFAIAESVNKKEVMQTLVNATKALKNFNPQEKKCISLPKIFVKRNQKFNIPEFEYQFSQPNMVFQLMKIEIRTRLHRFPFKKYGSVQKNSKKAAGIEKKIAFARNNSFRGYYL